MFLKKETFNFVYILTKKKMKERFKVKFLKEVFDFLKLLDSKAQDKVLFNIDKAKVVNDSDLFKKIDANVWEFRTLHNKVKYRLFAFWDKSDKENTVVISTHGIIKKTKKIPKKEIAKTDKIRIEYLENKKG